MSPPLPPSGRGAYWGPGRYDIPPNNPCNLGLLYLMVALGIVPSLLSTTLYSPASSYTPLIDIIQVPPANIHFDG